jgi:hypothetical protein
MGCEELGDFVNLYQEFLNKIHTYLIEHDIPKTEKHVWKCIYQTRAMDICHDHGCYWIFLDTYKSSQIWDIYYYMEDVIAQLKEAIKQ